MSKNDHCEYCFRTRDRYGCRRLFILIIAIIALGIFGLSVHHELQFHPTDEQIIDTTLQDHSQIPDSL